MGNQAPVDTGSVSFKGHGSDIGSLLCAFRSWLRGMVEGYDLELIAFEQPVRPISAANLVTMRQLYGIAGMVELVARDKALPVVEVKTNQLKKLIYGHGGKKPPKSEGLRLASEWGFAPEDMDQADACGVYLMVLKHRYPDDFMIWEQRRRERMIENGAVLV